MILSVFELFIFKDVRKIAQLELFLDLLHDVIRNGICDECLGVETLRLLLLSQGVLLLLVVAIVLVCVIKGLHVVLLLILLILRELGLLLLELLRIVDD